MAFDPPPHSRKIIVQIFSEKPSFKPCIKVKNLQYKFLDWTMNMTPPPPPLLGTPKINPFWHHHPFLGETILVCFHHDWSNKNPSGHLTAGRWESLREFSTLAQNRVSEGKTQRRVRDSFPAWNTTCSKKIFAHDDQWVRTRAVDTLRRQGEKRRQGAAFFPGACTRRLFLAPHSSSEDIGACEVDRVVKVTRSFWE